MRPLLPLLPTIAAALIGTMFQTQAVAVPLGTNFDVYAQANSSGGGTGLSTITLQAGQSFSVTVADDDLWSAGALPRWSNANGLVGDRFATGSDESGQAAGTLIGQGFGLYSGSTNGGALGQFAYGALVGQIDNGSLFQVGTNYQGVAAQAGALKLFYWDSNNGDNSGFVSASISAVPEPSTWALAALGLVIVGGTARRRRA